MERSLKNMTGSVFEVMTVRDLVLRCDRKWRADKSLSLKSLYRTALQSLMQIASDHRLFSLERYRCLKCCDGVL